MIQNDVGRQWRKESKGLWLRANEAASCQPSKQPYQIIDQTRLHGANGFSLSGAPPAPTPQADSSWAVQLPRPVANPLPDPGKKHYWQACSAQRRRLPVEKIKNRLHNTCESWDRIWTYKVIVGAAYRLSSAWAAPPQLRLRGNWLGSKRLSDKVNRMNGRLKWRRGEKYARPTKVSHPTIIAPIDLRRLTTSLECTCARN